MNLNRIKAKNMLVRCAVGAQVLDLQMNAGTRTRQNGAPAIFPSHEDDRRPDQPRSIGQSSPHACPPNADLLVPPAGVPTATAQLLPMTPLV